MNCTLPCCKASTIICCTDPMASMHDSWTFHLGRGTWVLLVCHVCIVTTDVYICKEDFTTALEGELLFFLHRYQLPLQILVKVPPPPSNNMHKHKDPLAGCVTEFMKQPLVHSTAKSAVLTPKCTQVIERNTKTAYTDQCSSPALLAMADSCR